MKKINSEVEKFLQEINLEKNYISSVTKCYEDEIFNFSRESDDKFLNLSSIFRSYLRSMPKLKLFSGTRHKK